MYVCVYISVMIEFTETRHPIVPVVIVRHGQQDHHLTRICSWVVREEMAATTRRQVTSDLKATLEMPGMIDPLTGQVAILGPGAREYVKAAIKRHNGRLVKCTGRSGYRVKGGHEALIARRLRTMCRVVEAANDNGVYDGPNLLLVDGLKDLTRAQGWAFRKGRLTKGGEEFELDIGLYFRPPSLSRAPNGDEVRWGAQALAALQARIGLDRAPMSAVSEVCYTIVSAGCRPGEPFVPMRCWQIHGFGRTLMLPNKHDGPGFGKRGILDASGPERFEAYVEGERRRNDPAGRGMAHFRELDRIARGDDAGAAAAAIAELEATPLFLNSWGGALTYAVFRHHYVRVCAPLGIPTRIHLLRHEYVFRRMRAIEDKELSPAVERRQRRALASYMGWRTGEAMLEVYDSFEIIRKGLEEAISFGQDVVDAVDAATPTIDCSVARPPRGRTARGGFLAEVPLDLAA